MSPIVWFAALITLTIGASASYAWGPKGHQYSGGIADQLLSAHARAEVKKNLGISLQAASTWADCVKDVDGKQASFTYVVRVVGRA
ncbi:MAG: hypothetical protein JW384_04067 [Nitrosomonadaceae bacterium]|nr:hypothetical protein [Nitrosomonadaceae bacterium]